MRDCDIRAGDGVPLGQDPNTGKDVFLRAGPYGPYVQLGVSPADMGDPKPARAPVKLKGCACFSACTFAFCQRQAAVLCWFHIPQCSSYVCDMLGHMHGTRRLANVDVIGSVLYSDELPSLAEALVLLQPAAPLGVHPADQQPVTLAVGKFGPYVRHGKVNAPIPKVHPATSIVTTHCRCSVFGSRSSSHAPHGLLKARQGALLRE